MISNKGQATDRTCTWRGEEDWSPCDFDSVQLWSVHLDRDESSLEKLTSLLSQEEKDRAWRYRFAIDRNRFIVRRGMLRIILARYLRTNPHKVHLRTGEFGKLQISDSLFPELEFSIAHSQGLALFALARERCVGVDVEFIQPLLDLELMINKCLSSSEKCHILALPTSQQLGFFYKQWTCREAYLKATGVGLSRSMNSLSIPLTTSKLDGNTVVQDKNRESSSLSVWSMIPFPGFIAATATKQGYTQHELFAI